MMKLSWSRLTVLAGLIALFSGCATLEVTSKKDLTPVVEKQAVTLGIQALGDRLTDTISDPQSSIIRAASGQLFDKVILLPKEARFKQPQEIMAATGVDYILSLGIGDISVSADLNPIWFASLPLFVFKIYTPIVTFQPGVAIDVTLRDARTGTVLIQSRLWRRVPIITLQQTPGLKSESLLH